jgi:hypothetical protein
MKSLDVKHGNLRPAILLGVIFLLIPFAAADAPPRMDQDMITLQDPVYDNEDTYCRALFEDPDDPSGRIVFRWISNGAQVDSEVFPDVPDGDLVESTLDDSYLNEGDLLQCNVTAIDDYGTPDEQKNSSFSEAFVKTDPPNVTVGPDFYNYSSEHAFNVSAQVRDFEGADDITQCTLIASDNDGSSHTYSMDIDRTFGTEDYARCFYSNVNNYSSGFDVLEDIEVEIRARDRSGDINYSSGANAIPNSLPRVFNINPGDDSRTASDEVVLEANVLDRDGEKVDVTFYNTTGGVEKLKEEKDIDEGTVSYVWQDLESLTNYYWVINASDGYSTRQVDLRFRNLISSQFRVQTSIDHRYSAILTAEDNTQIVTYTVRNTDKEPKTLISEIQGSADAEFVQYGSSYNFDLAPGEERQFRVEVKPSGDGRQFLNITTENQNYRLSVKDSIEVYPRSATATAPPVPGLALLQLLFIALASTLYCSVRP